MNQLETFLQQPLPQGEAAAFFIRLKGGEKTASTAEVLAQLEALPEAERAEILKAASVLTPTGLAGRLKMANGMMGAASPQLPAAAKGNAMPTPPPVQLPATAMGQNAIGGKMASAKVSPADVGKARGEANAAAHFERESHRHGERSGTTLGRVAGLAAGAAAAHKLGKGNPMVDIAGAALGQHVGAGLGRHAGKAHDERAFEKKHASDAQSLLANERKQQVDSELMDIVRHGGPENRDAARFNAFIQHHVIPREQNARDAAGLVAANTARHSPGIGAGIGGLAGAGLGALASKHLGGSAAELALMGGGLGLGLGGIAGKVQQHIAQGKAHDNTLTNQRKAQGIAPYVSGSGRGHTDFNQTDDIPKEWKMASSAFKLALDAMGGPPTAQPAQQDLTSPPGIEPKLDPEMAEYLANEQQADTQAMAAELAHARGALAAAMESQKALETKAQQLETQQQMTDSQLQQYQAQVADATQSAMGAQDQVLQQQQAAAAMRIAYQQLRGQLLQAASVDPPSLSGNEAALAAASSAAGPSSGPAPTEGPAGQAPSPGTAPNSAAPTGDDQVSARSQTSQQQDVGPTTSVGQKEPQDGAAGRSPGKESLASARLPFVGAEKVAALRDFLSNAMHEGMTGLKAVAPHAAVGGLVGGGLGLAESQMSNEPLRQKVQELEAKGDQRSTGDAINLAFSRGRLTLGEHAAKHPVASTAMGALMGATTGARVGPAFVNAAKSIKDDVGGIASDIKTIRGK